MKYIGLVCPALLFGILPAIGLSAPPQRCDDVPRAVTSPLAPSARTSVLPIEPPAPVAEPTKRQRIQALMDRVNKLKSHIENPPLPPKEEAVLPLILETPVVTPETVPSKNPDPATIPIEASPPVLIDLETVPPAPSVEQPRLAPQPELEPAPLPAPLPAVERLAPLPELPLPMIRVPEQATPIPPPAVSDISLRHEDSPLTLPSELLDHSIDRQRMGNNLYAIGAYELALMNYEKMLDQPLSPLETQWVQFQVANCQRKLGQITAAQKSYRRVAGDSSEEGLGQMARWWLKELDDREQLNRRVAELEQIIQTLEQDLSRAP